MKYNTNQYRPNRSILFYRGLLCSVLFLALSLQLNAAPRKDVSAPQPSETVSGTRSFTDSSGRTLEIPGKITKISPSGSLAQMFLLAIAPDLICTVSSAYSPDQAEFVPDYLMNLPVVGQFYGSRDLNPEEIARIGPDLVIDIGEPKDSIAQDMDAITQSIAIPAIHITATLRSTPQAFRTLGQLLDREEQGEKLALFCEKALSRVDDIVAKAGNNKKELLYCLGPRGINVLAAGSFHTEVLDWIANNKAVVDNPSSRGSGNETNLEQILLWDPELIIFGPDSVYSSVAADPTWKQLRAIRTGAYYEVPQGPYNWMGTPPSINRYIGMLWLGKILYPQYAQYDLYTETAEYYRLFYGRELSRERYERLTANSISAGGPGK
ncbi:periplasmic binding protein [Treponema primitia ZAS-2]|uniref:Periplasmic binding protein n=1 Tax=Treponema primitia (strain ATCC BAA-887 / DSM 12427 / ZAS-2) TaxID=545694 RepID=F5YH75_TREPZ|nr:ABC transporter substrate-binding protein [Treponema primitia]AEF86124.1 periplasmic binding protein [Treponema primitia ZAS-2]